MSGGEIASIIGGVTAFVAFIYGAWKTGRQERDSTENANASVLLGGWRDFHAEALKEVERVRATFQAQIGELKAEHEADRVQWEKEREKLQTEVDQLKSQILILIERGARP